LAQAPAVISRYRRELHKYLRDLISNHQPPDLYRMIRYHLGWEDADGHPAEHMGKELRPALCLLACEAVGGDWRRALPAAAAVELVHNFSLVHDDIQDRDIERHHRSTVWSVWGDAQAINAGDALLALARLSILRLRDEGVPADDVLDAARVLDERTLEMVEGQTMDLSFEERLDVGVEIYIDMIERKTGALFDCSLRLGALAAGCHQDLAEAMGRCGRLMGTAFQIRDDMLGIWGAESRTGKEPATDIRRRKKSLPAVYALTQAEGPTLDELRRVYTKVELTSDDVSLVLRTLDAIGAQGYCARLALATKQAALKELDELPLNSDAAQELRQTATFLLERDF
jgi:geranylgeranyl diphosphate synthase type I